MHLKRPIPMQAMPTTQSPGNRQLSRTNRQRTEHAASRISENYPNLAVSLECGSSLMRWDHVQRISASFRGFFSSRGRRRGDVLRDADGRKRCSWITEFSDEVYVSFHDKCWGVPVFHDSQLFEQLTLSGMLIDFNWTQILKRREWYREVFAKFDPNVVAKMDEKDIIKITSKKKFGLAESRVRCIIDNAKCVQKVVAEFGSFSGYIWSHVNHKPIIKNGRQHSERSINNPLKTPKSKAISKDLVSRGFRLVSPTTVYSFMQASGMAIDHELDCFRFSECVKVAERSWGMTSLGK